MILLVLPTYFALFARYKLKQSITFAGLYQQMLWTAYPGRNVINSTSKNLFLLNFISNSSLPKKSGFTTKERKRVFRDALNPH